MIKRYLLAIVAMIALHQPAACAHNSAPSQHYYTAAQLCFFAATFAYGCSQALSLVARGLRYAHIDYLGEYETEAMEKTVKAAVKKNKKKEGQA